MKTKTRKPKDKIELVLDGKVYVVETTNGKVVKKQLNGKMVLSALMAIVEQGLDKL
jgi:hypothetical protein